MRRRDETKAKAARWAAAALLLAALAGPAAAQQEGDWQERFGRAPGAMDNWLEFEVRSVEKKDLTVTAQDVEGNEVLSFRVPPESFIGQRFTADFEGAREGDRVSVQGLPEAKLENVKAVAPAGVAQRPARPGGGADAGPARRPRGPETPDGPAVAGRARHEYRITSIDTESLTITAVSETGGEVRLQIDPKAFEGYRFRVRTDQIRKGGGFFLLALNETPLSGCCTLVSRPSSR